MNDKFPCFHDWLMNEITLNHLVLLHVLNHFRNAAVPGPARACPSPRSESGLATPYSVLLDGRCRI